MLMTSWSLAALTPAERVPGETSVYIEGAPLSEGIAAMRTLVGTIAGEGVWSMLSAQFEQKIGANILDPAKLEEMGIDTKTPWALALEMQVPEAPNPLKPDFVMIIPSQQNSKLYEFLKSKVAQAQMAINKEVRPGAELHFGTEGDPGFMIRHENAVLVSNRLDMVKLMTGRPAVPLQNAAFYATMKQHLMSKNQNKAPLTAFYLNPKLIVSSLKMQTEMIKQLQKDLNRPDDGSAATAPTLDENSPYVQEIRENLQSAGGALIANGDRISFYFAYKYKEGYLSDTSKIYPKILQVNAKPMASDMLARNPLVHSMLKLNLAALIDFVKSLSPVFAEKFDKAMAEAKQETGIDLEKNIIANLRGNYNLSLLNLPADTKLKEMTAYEGFGTFGIKPGTGNEWVKLLKAGEKLAKKAEGPKKKNKSKWSYETTDDGQLVTITGTERGKSVSIVFLVREDDVIVSNTKLNAIKATKGTDKTLVERLMGLNYKSTQGIFFIDLQLVYKSVLKSKEGNSLKAYAQMLEKLKSFSVISSIQGDFASGESMLLLKK